MQIHYLPVLVLSILVFYFSNCSSNSDGMEEVMDCSMTTLLLSVESKKGTRCGENGGSIEVVGVGGTGSYRYSLNGGPQQSSGVFTDLPTGIHFIRLRDEVNCVVEEQILLASGVSLNQDVFNRIGQTCAITGCHVSGGQSPNFELKSNILTAAQNIKRRLEDNSMPPAGSGKDPMSDADKAVVICWVNDGALDN